MAKAQSRGEAIVSARHGSRAATARIFVLPSGTFALKGVVRELGFPIANVAVAVLSGEGQGLSVQSHEDGSYALYGVGGSVRLSLKKNGYLDSVQEVRVTAHMTRDLDIAAERGRSDYRGTYTSRSPRTARARDSMGDRSRNIEATRLHGQCRPAGRAIDGDPQRRRSDHFQRTRQRVPGYIEPPNVIRFKISDVNWDFYGYYATGGYDIAERVEGRAMMFSGVATVTGTPARLSGVFQGALALAFHATPPLQPLAGGCESGHHFEMMQIRSRLSRPVSAVWLYEPRPGVHANAEPDGPRLCSYASNRRCVRGRRAAAVRGVVLRRSHSAPSESHCRYARDHAGRSAAHLRLQRD